MCVSFFLLIKVIQILFLLPKHKYLRNFYHNHSRVIKTHLRV